MTTDDIRLIRLTNGTDLLSLFLEIGPGVYQLHDPIEVIFNAQTGRELVMMNSWLPASVVQKTSVVVLARDVLFITRVEGQIINSYLMMVGRIRASRMPMPLDHSAQVETPVDSNTAPVITSNTEVSTEETFPDDSLRGKFGLTLLSGWDPEGETPQ